jgi:hypothetical protein
MEYLENINIIKKSLMLNIMMKLFLAFMIFHEYHAGCLYTWTPAQTLTVGKPHPIVNIGLSSLYPDIALADPNDCASIAPLSGVGNFINYNRVTLSF